ncbi:hypothetical protein PF008_g20830 [Phytophthora fragariae]|uniref:CCHC-type domain-containing protein n=1 Tax=Phytophthora fragariae TaxID=53985 RepID=A0A6G0QYE0_9STRA|nr:hypothetical protein PF008_g20830 [Phytophthora fragariae]
MFTNPQGIYNKYSGKWDKPPGHKWNGKYWYEPLKAERKRTAAGENRSEQKKPASREKMRQEKADAAGSSGSESDTKPRRKRLKAAVRQATAQENTTKDQRVVRQGQQSSRATGCFLCGDTTHWASACPKGLTCFGCRKTGHYAKDCTDAEAKARSDEYRRTHPPKSRPEEN